MKRIRSIVLMSWMIATSAAGLTTTAMGDERIYSNYTQLNVGFNGFNDDLNDADYDDSGDIMLTYGHYLTPHLVLEGALDSFGSHGEFRGSTPIAGSYKREDDISVVAVLATLKGEWNTGPLTFFGGGGVGAYLLGLNSEITTTNLNEVDANDTDSVLGLHMVAGANYNITPRIFTGLQGMYRWTEQVDINKTVATVPVNLKGDLDGYAVTLNVGFRF